MVFLYVLIGLLGAMALVFTVQNPEPITLTFLNWRTTPLRSRSFFCSQPSRGSCARP